MGFAGAMTRTVDHCRILKELLPSLWRTRPSITVAWSNAGWDEVEKWDEAAGVFIDMSALGGELKKMESEN